MAALRRLLWPPPRLPPPPSPHHPFPGAWGRPAGIAPGPPGRPFSCREEEEGAVAEAAWRRRRRWGELSIAAAAGGGLVGLVCYQLYGDPRADSAWTPALERPSESSASEPEDPPRGRGLIPIPVAAAKETVAISRTDIEDLDLYATSRERRFRLFASIECEGQLFMTPYDFILAVTTDEPKFAKTWKSLTKQELNQMLSETPPVWKGSSKLFRNLKERGVISYTEYLFLLCILTKPHAGFRIAFNMFDTDGNEMVDKKEFLVLQEIFRKKNEKRETKGDEEKRAMLVLKTDAEELVSRSYWDTLRRNTSQALFSDLAERADDITSLVTDTTLLVHFFGKKGKAELNFEDFYRFMDNLQTEVLEIEFLSYSNGMNTISEEDFAHILLRYTNVENTSVFLENVRYSIPEEKSQEEKHRVFSLLLSSELEHSSCTNPATEASSFAFISCLHKAHRSARGGNLTSVGIFKACGSSWLRLISQVSTVSLLAPILVPFSSAFPLSSFWILSATCPICHPLCQAGTGCACL
ncbi:calcium uptake protein 3, mitochondrial isoform X3 [Neofelis nebulosa]|uniref:calcium uptake protein 3, mitochondrial isoform X3 n=1 Tax=Neofelis nebulosa TaxID=61452 RepID=UPI00272C15A5|nr:calcium uptake protein 3, mitochondrial isoform X3 [Neofelis nebulosa]